MLERLTTKFYQLSLKMRQKMFSVQTFSVS